MSAPVRSHKLLILRLEFTRGFVSYVLRGLVRSIYRLLILSCVGSFLIIGSGHTLIIWSDLVLIFCLMFRLFVWSLNLWFPLLLLLWLLWAFWLMKFLDYLIWTVWSVLTWLFCLCFFLRLLFFCFVGLYLSFFSSGRLGNFWLLPFGSVNKFCLRCLFLRARVFRLGLQFLS